ncbi:MAG TPA: tripartite tricarboxylate transporter substrate binding protein [Xanthobacteraceae bacterium]|nr:tripartite tricarboxylate transporter substrate binding protein [Xanthobacteraceae bacterium]
MRSTAIRATIVSAACLAAAMLALGIAGASAQTRRIIVPYTPGSGPDILARLMAEQIGAQNGPNMVVENRPGGGMVIGTEVAARAEPDGNTLLLVANAFVVNAALKRGNYDIARSFDPVCQLAATPMVVVVQGSSPYKTIRELVDAAKQKPGQLSFASGGPATSLHIAIEVLRRATGIDVNYVPYGGSLPAINALMGGHVQAVVADYPTIVAQLQAGVLRGLATTAAKRVDALPNVPTLSESGITQYEDSIFYGVVAPAGTPAATLKDLSGVLVTALKAPALQPRLAQQGLSPVGTCGAPFGAFLRTTVERYERVIKDANIRAN